MSLNLNDNKNNYFPALGLNNTLEVIQDYVNSNTDKVAYVTLSENDVLLLNTTTFQLLGSPAFGYVRIVKNILVKNNYGSIDYSLVGDVNIQGGDNFYASSILQSTLLASKSEGILQLEVEARETVYEYGGSVYIYTDNAPTLGNSSFDFTIIYNDYPLSV
jgi:hypothetical protein